MINWPVLKLVQNLPKEYATAEEISSWMEVMTKNKIYESVDLDSLDSESWHLMKLPFGLKSRLQHELGTRLVLGEMLASAKGWLSDRNSCWDKCKDDYSALVERPSQQENEEDWVEYEATVDQASFTNWKTKYNVQ